MSSDLRLKISGDWYDIREASLDPGEAARAAGLDAALLRSTAGELRGCVEGGILEYKRSALHRTLSPLESLAFDSRALSTLSKGVPIAGGAAWCCLQQRRIAMGRVSLESNAKPGESGELRRAAGAAKAAEDEMSPGELIGVVQGLLTEEPELREEPEAKMVFLQLKQYKQEMMKLKELLVNIPEEKRKPLRENFAYRLREIIGKVEQGYRALLQKSQHHSGDDQQREQEQFGLVLARVDRSALSGTAKRFLQEAELFSRIRSVLLFAEKERYQSRQILLDVKKVGEELQSLIVLEKADYKRLAPFGDGGQEIAFEMARLVRDIATAAAKAV